MKVSRTAFYARRSGLPGPRAVRDAELTEQITEVHAESRGTYGAPRVHDVLAELHRIRLGHCDILPGHLSASQVRCHLSVQQSRSLSVRMRWLWCRWGG
ncbi:IS3 family transposase [Streptomyces sp. wa13]|uniref:IS3 family transposase n=1 Tax=Streptomyces sp. wa13 TaxID=1828236 RepID=UPI003C7D5DBB